MFIRPPVSLTFADMTVTCHQTSTVILGATKVHQLEENLKALDVLPKITHDIYKRMNNILGNEPTPEVYCARIL